LSNWPVSGIHGSVWQPRRTHQSPSVATFREPLPPKYSIVTSFNWSRASSPAIPSQIIRRCIFCYPSRLSASPPACKIWHMAQSYRVGVNAIKNCNIWYDNSGDYSCKDIRDSLSIKPETFTRWNPSISLDCEKWQLYTSYCTWVDSEAPTLTSSTTVFISSNPTP
jgi:hypothetical protein